MGKREKKDKKERREKKRKRERSDSSDGEDERAQARVRKEADRLAKALLKQPNGAAVEDDGDGPPAGRFVWKKKLEQELQGGAKTKDLYARERANTETERMAEIEKVRRRREERESERQQREAETEQLARDRAAAEAVELERREDEFHLENAKARVRHRLKEGRAQPIDLLARDLLLAGEGGDGGGGAGGGGGDSAPPYAAMQGLAARELRELREDIQEYQELDSMDESHAAWWGDLLLVCEEELQEAERQEAADRAASRAGPGGGEAGLGAEPPRLPRERGLHSAVDAEISSLLSGQSYAELVLMEGDLQHQLQSNTAPDPEFHAAVLRRMPPHKARARLRDAHATLRARAGAAADARTDVPAAMGWRQEYEFRPPPGSPEPQREREQTPEPADERQQQQQQAEGAAAAAAAAAGGPAGRGQWSPAPLEPGEYAAAAVVAEEADAAELQQLRTEVKRRAAASFGVAADGAAGAGGLESEELDEGTRRLRARAASSMGDMNEARDAPFGGEVQLESKVYWWNDKYRPRKPKYYNRVHTGYEWNKYNQTHYDHDNPPPKVVQGYKFNMFFPDLIDKRTAPTYGVEKDPAADEFGSTCILRFQAGPPYEDMTFRILNKEWEYSHKKGFKCVFERDTLYLYFNFRRNRYRR